MSILYDKHTFTFKMWLLMSDRPNLIIIKKKKLPFAAVCPKYPGNSTIFLRRLTQITDFKRNNLP